MVLEQDSPKVVSAAIEQRQTTVVKALNLPLCSLGQKSAKRACHEGCPTAAASTMTILATSTARKLPVWT